MSSSTSSSSSDSECEFYDAEEETPSQSARKPRKASSDSLRRRSNSEPSVLASKDNKSKHQPATLSLDHKSDKFESVDSDKYSTDTTSSTSTVQYASARQKFKELRQKLQNDDEEGSGNVSPPGNSRTSSVEGVFAATSNRPSQHKFRVVEQDTISLQSINSVGRLLRLINTNPDSAKKTASVSALSSSSLDSESTQSSTKKFPSTFTLSGVQTSSQEKPSPTTLQEPDVIASTKASNWPVAPPRRKKKNRGANGASIALTKSASSAAFITSGELASPASTIESLTRDIERSLDCIPSAAKTSTAKYDSPSVKFENPKPKSEHKRVSVQSDAGYKQNVKPTTGNHKNDKYLQADRHSDDSRSSTLRSGNSLDITQATKGQFVVKPYDTESLKAQSVPVNTGIIKPIILEQSSSKERGERRNILQDMVTANRSSQGPSSSGMRRLSSRSGVGHYSLGPHRGTHQSVGKSHSRDRRKSAGDENFLYDLNLKVRTHTDSGKQLSDMEILEQVTVLNLDTGERIPLSVAEDKLPQCINPLSLHIMRLTSEYVSSSSMDKDKESDEESVDTNKKSDIPMVDDNEGGGVRKKTARIKRFLGSTVKKTMHKAKSIAQEVSHARHKEDVIDIVDNVHPGEQNCKLKASNSHKGPLEFEKIEHVQELRDGGGAEKSPIWCMKFSTCGRLFATGGQDNILRIWVIRDAYPFFQDMRTKYNAEKVSPTPSQESLVSHHSTDTANFAAFEALSPEEASKYTFMPKPFCTYTGHTSDLLDIAWSKNYFILSASFDKTVRLWHISRKECLCCFQHIDFVSAIVFHPRDDRYFLSGSLDGKLRLWNIPDKKVAVWNEVEDNNKLITAANFCQNGKFAVVGTYDGRCIFYITDQLKYHTQIHVRSSRGRNAIGRKISGIEPMPGEDKILVTSNDSRIRLYDLRDLNVCCKYKGKGYSNESSQIRASFSHDGKYIVTGSEKHDIFIWKTKHDYSITSVRKDRNDFWEAIKAHNVVVTCAIFAPNPEAIIKMLEESQIQNQDSDAYSPKVEDPVVEQHTKNCAGYVLVSADYNGCIKVFINKTKPKHSSLPVSALA